MTKAKTAFICAKCSDLCSVTLYGEDGNEIVERNGYVPDWMPDEHYGDYVMLEIELATGKILNWKVPEVKTLEKWIEETK